MKRVPLIPAVIGTGLLTTGATVSFHLYVSPRPPVVAMFSTTTAQQQFGLNEYTMLKAGMTLTEVRSILGKGTEIKSTADSATYEWKNTDGSSIHCYFKQGKLELKEQSKLG